MEPKNELQRNAIALARRKELESFQRALDIEWLNSRMEDGRTGRCLALIEREAEMEKDFQERTDHAAIVNARAEKETKLGMEISKVRAEEVNELMRRHYLRERDPSLRVLQKKLQAGYVCRDLRQQILHNEYKHMQDKVEASQANRVLLNALYNDAEAAEREARDKMEKNTQYTMELQQQLVNRQRQRQCEYEETLIEKKMQEGIIRTLADEDQREIAYKREQTDKMRAEMVQCQGARRAWKEKQKRMVVLEEREIEAQIRAQGDRSAAVVAERERKMLQRERQTEIIGEKLLAEQAERQKREDVIKLLQEQEYLEKNAQDDIAERVKAEKYREETKESFDKQFKVREKAARDQALAEAEFRKESERQMALSEEKEKEKERKKKDKNHQYFLDLKKQIADNEVRRKADHELEERRNKHQFDYDKAWLAEVAEERKMIIEEHVPPLVGFLQAGVIKREDLPVAERQKREDVIKLLQEQEYLEKNAQDDIAERVKAEKYREETKESFDKQFKVREKAARDQALAEAEFRKESDGQMGLSEEKEKEKERKKKDKNHQYFLDLEEQIADNAVRRKADHELEERRNKHEFDYDKAWLAEVAEERKMIMEEHVPPLVGFLQAGVIKHEDMPVVRKGANKSEDLAKLDIESMAISNRPHRFAKCNDQCKVIRED